jgi:hypothetical protein
MSRCVHLQKTSVGFPAPALAMFSHVTFAMLVVLEALQCLHALTTAELGNDTEQMVIEAALEQEVRLHAQKPPKGEA